MEANIFNTKGEKLGSVELPKDIFEAKINIPLMHEITTWQLACRRQGTHAAKNRADVSGSGKKPWKQKGTGRARAGSSRSPIWIGGGVTFGPRKDRNFKQKINQKMKQKALFMALSDKVATNALVILDNLQLTEYKTKKFNAFLTDLEKKVLNTDRRDILIINDVKDEKTLNSGRNLTGVKIINLENINLLDILHYKNLLLTANGIKILTGRYTNKK